MLALSSLLASLGLLSPGGAFFVLSAGGHNPAMRHLLLVNVVSFDR